MYTRAFAAILLSAASVAHGEASDTSAWPPIRFGTVPAQFDFCSPNSTLAFAGPMLQMKKVVTDLQPISSKKANEMRDFIQSQRGPWDKDMFTKESVEWDEYVRGLVINAFPIIMFIFAAIAILAFIPFALGRFFRDCGHFTPCCEVDDQIGKCLVITACGCWCYKLKSWNTYTRLQRMLPVLLYLFFGACAIGAAVAALYQIADFSDGITNIICEADSLREETGNFVRGITGPMSDIATTAGAAIDRVQVVLAGTSAVSLSPVLTALAGLRSTLENLPPITLPDGTAVDDGGEKAKAIAEVVRVQGEAEGQAATLSADLTNMRTRVDGELVGAKGAIADVSNVALRIERESSNFLDGDLKSGMQQIKDVFAYPRHQTYVGASFAVVLTVVPMFFVLLGYFLIVAGTHLCAKCGGKCGEYSERAADQVGEYSIGGGSCCHFLGLILVLVLGGACVPAAYLTSDLCVVAETLPSNVQLYMDAVQGGSLSGPTGLPGIVAGGGASAGGAGGGAGASAGAGAGVAVSDGGRRVLRTDNSGSFAVPAVQLSPAAILDSCFRNVSLDRALNLTDSFSFASIDFSQLDALVPVGTSAGGSVDLGLDSFAQFKADVQGLTPESFGYDQTTVDTERAKLVTASNCPDPVCTQQQRDDAAAGIVKLDGLKGEIQAQIDSVQTSFAGVDGAVTAFQASVDSLYAGLQAARVDAEGLVEDAQFVLENNLYCGFVGPAYDSIYHSMCNTSLGAVWYLGVCLLCVGLATAPLIVANVFILFRNSHLLTWRHGPNADPKMRASWREKHGDLPSTHSFHDGRQWHDGSGGLPQTYSKAKNVSNNPMHGVPVTAQVEMGNAVPGSGPTPV